MKKHIRIILYCSILSLLTGFTSCNSYLDKAPSSSINSEAAYMNFFNFQGFTEELYSCIPDFANRDQNNFFNNGEEEIWQQNAISQAAFVYEIDAGNFWAWQVESGCSSWMDKSLSTFSTLNGTSGNAQLTKGLWPGCWYGIRKANLGLANLSKMSGTQQEKNAIAGQLYFFRGWFHFQLIQWFGGLPYINKVLPADQQLTLPRLSYNVIADSIAKDFQRAADLLPGNWDDPSFLPGQLTATNNALRINKWMALAYLGENYLWAGSPLMNMVSGGAEEYNKDYCKKAAEAFGTLLQASENGSCQYSLIPWSAYSENYRTNGESGKMPGSATVGGVTYNEAIFRGPYWGGTGLSTDKEYLCAMVLQSRSWSQYPTANYVNYFGMDNGLPINNVSMADVDDSLGSGYNIHYPWKHRDPRFYINIAYDTKRMVNSTGASAKSFIYANLYTSGNYRDPSKGMSSGYLLLKYDPVGFNMYDNAYNNHVIHPAWIRLADVYLMYSEAVANGYGDLTSTSTTFPQNAVYAINKVRNRVLLPNGSPFPGVNAKFLGSVGSFMPELRRERAVELAYEGHRFMDLRRWHLLSKYPYNIKTQITFDRAIKETSDASPTNLFVDKNVPENNRINNLKESVVWTRNFSEKHYWLPLKRADVTMYPGFAQNPGW